MNNEITKEKLLSKRMGGSFKLFQHVKELKEITNDLGEVNRLLSDSWIVIGVVSNSGNLKHVMGRVEFKNL